ncbi:MAG TPA: hypothetical protein VML55_02600 [Planctomycetaceae bacterium]|nr:hypothetical protein [Planctomycetaceae bacterium]
MRSFSDRLLAPLFVLGLAAGCGTGVGESAAERPAEAGPTDSSQYVLAAEPEGAKGVREVRNTSADGDEVVIVGRVGGAEDPFLRGYAGFTIVDASVKHCGELHDDGCPTPWDYCCSPPEELEDARALVTLVDARGSAVKGDAKALAPVREMKTVVVRGKARRDEAGNLTIEATGIHVRS